ncbi:MAG: prepilin-type N-terminal cleavage/methylation domain-containing protein [Planctomycetota bacterium]
MRQRQGFTLIESVTLLTALSIGGALGAAALTLNGSKEKAMQNSTQLKGIHRSFVVFAQSNKKGGNDGYFPGLNPAGDLVDGSTEGRLQLLLEGNFFTGDDIVSPLENLTSWTPDRNGEEPPLFPEQHSYAMLRINEPLMDDGRRLEWKETLNTAAIVLGDRNTSVPETPRSVWSEGTEHEDWAGGVTRNDNSTSFETSPKFDFTKFGNRPANEQDHLFIAETAEGSDTLLTFSMDAFGHEVPTPRRNDADPPALPVIDGAM